MHYTDFVVASGGLIGSIGTMDFVNFEEAFSREVATGNNIQKVRPHYYYITRIEWVGRLTLLRFHVDLPLPISPGTLEIPQVCFSRLFFSQTRRKILE